MFVVRVFPHGFDTFFEKWIIAACAQLRSAFDVIVQSPKVFHRGKCDNLKEKLSFKFSRQMNEVNRQKLPKKYFRHEKKNMKNKTNFLAKEFAVFSSKNRTTFWLKKFATFSWNESYKKNKTNFWLKKFVIFLVKLKLSEIRKKFLAQFFFVIFLAKLCFHNFFFKQ